LLTAPGGAFTNRTPLRARYAFHFDTEMLRAAQKNPGQYRDLAVRVAGFSEFFVNLTPEMQDEIVARTAH